jgi:hypothetical protein
VCGARGEQQGAGGQDTDAQSLANPSLHKKNCLSEMYFEFGRTYSIGITFRNCISGAAVPGAISPALTPLVDVRPFGAFGVRFRDGSGVYDSPLVRER